MEKKYFFIFIGDTHGFLDDFKKQKEMITKIKPEIVLSEQLQDKKIEKNRDYEDILKNKKFRDSFKLINLCKQNKIRLVGIDLKDFGFNKKLTEIINGKKKPTKEDELKISKILEKREKHQNKKLKEFYKKSEKPIIVIVGTWHLRENSPIFKGLTDYKMIIPCNSKGEIVVEPTKEKIRYCIKDDKNNKD